MNLGVAPGRRRWVDAWSRGALVNALWQRPPLSRRQIGLFDVAAIASSSYVALVLLAAVPFDPALVSAYATFIPIALVARTVVNEHYRLGLRAWEYASLHELWLLVRAGVVGSFLSMGIYAFGRLVLPTVVPMVVWSYWPLEGLLSLTGLSGLRLAVRTARDRRAVIREAQTATGVRTLLYGAGHAGATIARSALRDPDTGVVPVGFLDDDPRRRGQTLAGLPVYGALEDLETAATRTRAKLVLVTMPRAAGSAVRRVMDAAIAAGLEVRTVPGIHELITGRFDAYRTRRVRLEDLLRRPANVTHVNEATNMIRGRRVLITGAGGSIGSELARQVWALAPESLVLIDRAESPLYTIQRELEVRKPDDAIESRLSVQLANVASRGAMRRIFRAERPHVVLHAAAYKHVPMMEQHPSDAVHVNVGGTLSLLDAALDSDVERFVLVSTDKAVEPSSVMGATKRIAEWLVTAAAIESSRPYVSVRFGNVLGSTGSVVPILEQQLERGEPLTITHPDMTRYFMTIPEASALILDAAALGQVADLFVLDMGEPIRIVDLARDLVRLAGRNPDNVPLRFTGLRPGEKLHERLFYENESVTLTQTAKVMTTSSPRPPERIGDRATELIRLALGDDEDALREMIMQLVRPDAGSVRPAISTGVSVLHESPAYKRSVAAAQ